MSAIQPMDQDVISKCCGCNQIKVTNDVLMLDFKGPSPGKGWGCMVCNLPNDGAIAVLCEDCFKAVESHTMEIQTIVTGYIQDNQRQPLPPEDQRQPWQHDMEKHAAFERMQRLLHPPQPGPMNERFKWRK